MLALQQRCQLRVDKLQMRAAARQLKHRPSGEADVTAPLLAMNQNRLNVVPAQKNAVFQISINLIRWKITQAV